MVGFLSGSSFGFLLGRGLKQFSLKKTQSCWVQGKPKERYAVQLVQKVSLVMKLNQQCFFFHADDDVY